MAAPIQPSDIPVVASGRPSQPWAGVGRPLLQQPADIVAGTGNQDEAARAPIRWLPPQRVQMKMSASASSAKWLLQASASGARRALESPAAGRRCGRRWRFPVRLQTFLRAVDAKPQVCESPALGFRQAEAALPR